MRASLLGLLVDLCLSYPKKQHLSERVFTFVFHLKTKVQTRSDKCCLIFEGATQYRLFDPSTNQVLSRQRNVDFIEDEFLDGTAFLKVPYAERPLQVPEPRNYTEFDEELDEDEIADFFPEIKMVTQTPDPVIPMTADMPAARVPIDSNAQVPPRWKIPSPTPLFSRAT